MVIFGEVKNRWLEIQKILIKHEQRISSAALVFGFIIDSFTLRRIDLLIENTVLVTYLLIAALSIVFMHIIESKRLTFPSFPSIHTWLIIALQFAFGGLASAFLIFYIRSANISASWPFLFILFVYLISNEVLKKSYTRLWFHVGVLFLAINSYFIFLVPVVIGKIGDLIFILSSVLAIIFITLFSYTLYRINPDGFGANKKNLLLTIGGIFVSMQILYFTNSIPPIPLALKDSGVYHSVTRLSGGEYELVGESKTPLYLRFLFPRETIHYVRGESIYAWSAIFAPTRFKTNIIHVWQKHNSKTDTWETVGKINLHVSGGRDDGFRTYSEKSNLTPGKWRVNVETPNGKLVGRIVFTAKEVYVVPNQRVLVR